MQRNTKIAIGVGSAVAVTVIVILVVMMLMHSSDPVQAAETEAAKAVDDATVAAIKVKEAEAKVAKAQEEADAKVADAEAKVAKAEQVKVEYTCGPNSAKDGNAPNWCLCEEGYNFKGATKYHIRDKSSRCTLAPPPSCPNPDPDGSGVIANSNQAGNWCNCNENFVRSDTNERTSFHLNPKSAGITCIPAAV